MFAVLATMIFSCGPQEAAPPSGWKVPDVLMSHCLAGLDPHMSGVTARKLRNTAGYHLDLGPLHSLRYAGFEDGDFVYSANGHPLGTADAWHLARERTRGQTRCVWEVARQGSHMELSAELVQWPAPEPPQSQPDGTVLISRTALVLALQALPEGLQEEPSVGPYYPHGGHELQQVMIAAGLPEFHAVNAGGKKLVRSSHQLLEVIGRLLVEDQSDFVLRDVHTGQSQALRVLATGPAFPAPPWPPQLSDGLQVVLVDAELLQILGDSMIGWSKGQKERACRGLAHRGEDGQIDGYRLSAIQRRGSFEQMGFRNGDILHSIDGLELRGGDQLRVAGESLRNTSWAEVKLRRRGETVTLFLQR
jgi:hypothetical protein